MSSILTEIDLDTTMLLLPEILMLIGIVAMILIPNLGDATMRIPLTRTRVPIFIGGTRSELNNDPRLPNMIACGVLILALLTSFLFLGEEADVGNALHIDEFSRLFTLLFISALLLAALATSTRMPAKPKASAPLDSDSDEIADTKVAALIDNRRQVDFHILLLTTGLGMSLMAMATNLFMLFVCLELASLSSYVLVAFHKETDVGGEAGMKYFMVGSVVSAIGIYGMSLLYLWSGSLDMVDLAASWSAMETNDPLAMIGVGLMMVAFGFKVGAAPFHLAVPDAYSGASSPIAGLLATASKAMGFVALIRLLLVVTMPPSGQAIWMLSIGIIAVLTMTWGNLAALTSDNPKRMLAYSSVAHAGYMLAAMAAIGSGLADTSTSSMILTAVVFHLLILVLFKFGAFLVLSMLEADGGGHRIEDLYGLVRREPAIGVAMFVFMLSLAGVPPLSGFLSKLLMINGIVSVSAGTGAATSTTIVDWAGGVDPLFWLAVAIVLNSALSLFYYLRIGLVMFFESSVSESGLRKAPLLRLTIFGCAFLTLMFGIGPMSEWLLDMVSSAVDTMMGL
ncbi:MAG: NADH-quinone oxidoreductase subunit N [Candidatus Thermoplasmatota archaeon]|nr:NADH-quinone oxidoreductase subunit N [Candidatus Thermoplasmatota archaeon]